MQGHPMSCTRSEQGFTLVEVMVAVAIIGVALPAFILSLLKQVDSVAYLRDKLEAQLIAENMMTELFIRNGLSGEVPRSEDGTQELASRKWYYETDFKEYPQEALKDVFAVEIKVWLKSDDLDVNTTEEKPLVTFYGALYKKQQKEAIQRPKIDEYPVKRHEKKGS